VGSLLNNSILVSVYSKCVYRIGQKFFFLGERCFGVSSSSILGNINIYKTAIVTHGSVNSQSKTKEEKDRDCAEVNTFVQLHSGKSLLIFTDGSVHNGSVGCGACAAVPFPLSLNENHITCVEPVGKKCISSHL